MINGIAAAVFLGIAILFMGIANTWGIWWVWILVVLNGLLFVLNLMIYFANESKQRD